MSLRYISNRIELSFWQFVINLLSESKNIQHLVRWVYQELLPGIVSFRKRIKRKQAIRWAAFGLGLGLLTGTLISFF